MDAMENLEIPPRNFHKDKAENWHRSPNPLGIFLTLTNGARGQMRGYSNSLNPEERWALAHFILEEWVPDENQTETTQADLRNLCRQRSQVAPPTPLTGREDFESPEEAIQHAMDRLAADAPEDREIQIERYGDVQLSANADAKRGREVYGEQCASCHGSSDEEAKFPGKTLGPAAAHRAPNRETQAPTLYLDVRPLKRGHAGGTYRDFSRRAMGGVHATLPEAASLNMLGERDWKDLQAYVAKADGDANITRQPPSKPSSDNEGSRGEDDADDTTDASDEASDNRESPDAPASNDSASNSSAE